MIEHGAALRSDDFSVEFGESCPVLSGVDLTTGYGRRRALNKVALKVWPGEIVAVIGHNGAGKSTLLKALCGCLPLWEGSLTLDDRPLRSPRPQTMLRQGVALLPQGHRVFGELTVAENLQVFLRGLDRNARRAALDRALDRFPPLQARMAQRAGTLSGGEKQFLALAAVWALPLRVLLLDEPSLGIASHYVPLVFERIRQMSRDSNVAVIVVEQKVREVLALAQRAYVLRNGGVMYEGAAEVLTDAKLREVYF